MAKKSDKDAKAEPTKESASKTWESLTWQDLEAWAGSRSVSRGQSYQRQGRVRDLARSADERLLATVIGGDRYFVTVSMDAEKKKDGRIHSKCTCPVGYDGCKHAVAVVGEYLDRLGRRAEIPIADAEDPRWGKLANNGDEVDFDEDEIDQEVEGEVVPVRHKSGQRTRENWDEKIRQHIHAKSREDLAELVWSLTQRFSELRDEFRERIALGEGDVDRLIAQARKELQRVTSQEAWRNHWNGEGSLPDYSKLLHRFERLVELGHSDSVAQLGGEIIQRGMAQVGQSHDEGETAMELAGCLAVVFKAVANSNLPPAQKLIFAINACLQDDYGVIDDSVAAVLDAKYQPDDWSEVADDLARRLNAGKSGRRKSDDDEEEEEEDDLSRDYQRDQVSGWLIRALNNAGRGDELLAVYEKEAKKTGSYERLVKFLIEQKQYDDAERWVREGIEKTTSKLPGIAANLAQQLCEVARLRKQWDIVAAHAAYQFFDRPSRETFNELINAAEKADCRESVKRFATAFLENGILPIRVAGLKKGGQKVQVDEGWPLPIPEYLSPFLRSEDQRRSSTGPHYDVLIDMAIADERPEDVLRWYDTLCIQRKQSPYGSSWSGPGTHGDRVAEAVAESHPQRAIDIYRQQVDQNLTRASVGAYETVAAYLRKMKPIMKSMGRENDWAQLVEDIRLRHRNRPRFMEILERLENRTILATSKSRR